MTNSGTNKRKSRVLRIAAKVLMLLSLALLCLLILIHIPAIQQFLARKAATYLSSKTNSTVSIDHLNFNIFGEIGIEGIEVFDPVDSTVLLANSINIDVSPIEMIRGIFHIKDVSLNGVDGRLIQSEDGLNIDYFIDAFQSEDTATTVRQRKPFTLEIDHIDLRDISFRFLSDRNSLDLSVQVADLVADHFALSTIPGTIEANTLVADSIEVDIILARNESPITTGGGPKGPIQLPKFDFGSGFSIDLNALDLDHSSFSYHANEVIQPPKFDPNHLDINDFRISALDMSMHEEALSVHIDTFSALLPIIQYTELAMKVDANLSELMVSDFILRSGNSNVNLGLAANYPSWPDLLSQIDKTECTLSVSGILDPQEFTYFLTDSLLSYLDTWSRANVDLQAKFNNSIVQLESFDVQIRDSRMALSGDFRNLHEGIQAVRWDALNLDVNVGSAFHNTLSKFADSTYLPDSIHLQVSSSGLYDTFEMIAQANTNWGTVLTRGRAGIKDAGFLIDMDIDGQNVRLNDIAKTDRLGTSNFSLHTAGMIDSMWSLQVGGVIHDISVLDQVICDIELQGHFYNDSVIAAVSILDSLYRLDLNAEVFISDQVQASTALQLNGFNFGRILGRDTSTFLTGDFNSEATISDTLLDGFVRGQNISMWNDEGQYETDTFDLEARISPVESIVSLLSDDITGDFHGNFDLREFGVLIDSIITDNFTVKPNPIAENIGKTFDIQLEVKNDDILQLVDLEFEEFRRIVLSSRLDQEARALSVSLNTGHFDGLGISCDTVSFNFLTNVNELISQIDVTNIEYDSIGLGDLKFEIFSAGDSSGSALSLLQDSVKVIDLISRLSIVDEGMDVYPDQLVIFDRPFNTSWESPVFVSRDSFSFDQLKISDASKNITIHGTTDQYDITLENLQLKAFNVIVSRDSALIKSGQLNGNIAFDKSRQKFDGQIRVDSLRISNSDNIQIRAEAHTDGSSLPFDISMSSKTNNIKFLGEYQFKTSEIDATLGLDLADAHLFDLAFQNFVDIKSGSMAGDLSITGLISQPDLNGELNIKELQVVASGTKSTVNIKNQQLKFNDSGLQFDDFTIFDQKNNPLVINGAINTENYKSIIYDLSIYTDNYILFDQPRTDDKVMLRGILVVASDIKLTGNHKETYLDAKVTVKDTSNLIFVMEEQDIEIISDEGIVQFVDPNDLSDSVIYVLTPSFYDSLVAALPKLDFNSAITLEKNAILKVVVDPRSGDYIEGSGAANLELKLDRTGNLQLNGDYTITNGIYQLSFYGIAKKKFEIEPRSKVQWTGDPKNGYLDVLAIHRVKTSSSGLIGHEVGENEQSLYRKALDYEVGIVIKGTIEKPEVSFTLDLPDDEKANYPALANKLGRLSQPEYESELNKQVFGLLVLGGFMPETAGSDVGELAVTTTLTNSVSSILTSQLNRFVNENIEGLEFDLGLQTYSDYSSGGGQTRTSMDFRVTKRMMDDRLSVEIGAEMDLNADQSGANTGQDSFRGDIAIIYDLTESGNKKLKAFNNETYDIIYHEIRNTGIALILIKEFDRGDKNKRKRK